MIYYETQLHGLCSLAIEYFQDISSIKSTVYIKFFKGLQIAIWPKVMVKTENASECGWSMFYILN